MTKIPETITEDELRQILKEVKKPKRRLAFMLGFYQCMRISEVVSLNKEHIDLSRRIIRIKDSKGGKDRNIPIAPELLRGLKYLPMNVTARAIQISFRKYAQEILKKDLNFHNLRHSGATYYLNVKKWNLRQVQRFLGHARISTTEIYTHVNDEDLMDAMWEGFE